MNEQKRLRLSYAKSGFLRFTSNLDIQKIFERSLRRAGILLVFSQGFHPQAKIQQASPLPLGFYSESEVIDLWIDSTEDDLPSALHLNSSFPEGIVIKTIQEVPISSKSLQSQLIASEYRLDFQSEEHKTTFLDLIAKNDELLFRKHNGKQYDIKPLIQAISDSGEHVTIILSNKPNATARPDHLLKVLNIDPAKVGIVRKRLLFNDE